VNWKARDWIGCFVAALAAAVAGAVFGRMIGLAPGVLGEGWMKMGSLDFKQEPHWYYGVTSFLPLVVLCVILRLTLFKEFPASRRQRAVIFPMMLGPALALGVTAALVVIAFVLGYPGLLEDWAHSWRYTIQSAARGQLYNAFGGVAFIVMITFVQGAALGGVAGVWFIAPLKLAGSSQRAASLSLAVFGAFAVLLSVAYALAESLKKGRDRAVCILNCRNVQQAMWGYSGTNGHNPGDSLPGFSVKTLAERGMYSAMPCPGAGHYSCIEGRIPKVGELMIRCSCPEHVPPDHGDW
jgi:hypothetical protein